MVIIVKVKNTDNIIGLKEDIAMRLEGVVDIKRIDVLCEKESIQNTIIWRRKEKPPCKTLKPQKHW